MTILVSVEWYLIVVSVCISLEINAVEYFSCAYWTFVNFGEMEKDFGLKCTA